MLTKKKHLKKIHYRKKLYENKMLTNVNNIYIVVNIKKNIWNSR